MLRKQWNSWDAVEECWEIYIPIPHCITIEVPEDDTLEVALELHDLLLQNGLTYNNTCFDGPNLTIVGIDHENDLPIRD